MAAESISCMIWREYLSRRLNGSMVQPTGQKGLRLIVRSIMKRFDTNILDANSSNELSILAGRTNLFVPGI